MRTRYAVIAMTGLNDPSKRLRNIERDVAFWDCFADAKAEAVARAVVLREYLDSSGRRYRVHSVSGPGHYEIWFEYGPGPFDPSLPFRTVLDVCKCNISNERPQEAEL